MIHAAGTLGYDSLPEISLTRLQSVLRAKVQGAWLLHQLTQKQPLDFFVCFSSIASVWGSKKQAHYAAANHFLDGLAHYRQALGLPALSINWGPWAKGGMASCEAQSVLKRMGVEALSPEKALEAFGYLLTSQACQNTVADINWPVFKAIYTAQKPRPLLEQLEIQAFASTHPQQHPLQIF
ncbi:MAG TPA: KR domain-containing protein [Thiotrichaceae bacterium]|nr:KR domain-containing protein [Thiotrichaceae bacterium]